MLYHVSDSNPVLGPPRMLGIAPVVVDVVREVRKDVVAMLTILSYQPQRK